MTAQVVRAGGQMGWEGKIYGSISDECNLNTDVPKKKLMALIK